MFKRIWAALLTAALLYPAAASPALCEEIRDYEMPVVADIPLETAFNDPDLADEAPDDVGASLADAPQTDGDSLLRAQKLLIKLGYLGGAADGIYGPMTEAALRAFQEANDLSPTGRADRETLSALDRLIADTASTAQIQQRLIDLGYLQGTADGKWGPRSAAAMKAFQEMNGLPATGKADAGRLFSDDVIALPSGLSAGARGDEVTALQSKLIRYGFLSGRADGVYGRQTSKAVRALQEHLNAQGYSVSADGAASPVTLYYLDQPDLSLHVEDVAVGSTGAEAKRVETRLNSLGYMDVVPDEAFDGYAAQALALFQKASGLSVNGVADRKTSDALFSASAPAARRCALHDISKGDSGLVVQYVEQALYTGGMVATLPGGRYDSDVVSAIERLYAYAQATVPESAGLFADASHLSTEAVTALLDGLLGPQGADGSAEVARIQRRLHALYYLDKYDIDGRLGSGTASAIRDFQSANGLAETGETDRRTLARLFSADALARRFPYRVEVSLNDQSVTVYQLNDANGYDQVQRFTCSTGLRNSTPRGIFLDGYPANRWHYFKKFDCWAQYSYEIEGNIMFHSVLYSDKDTSTLREGSVYALGSPASHGCIRLSVQDAKWLYEHCKRGTAAIVIY